jgi:hypothetical protein
MLYNTGTSSNANPNGVPIKKRARIAPTKFLPCQGLNLIVEGKIGSLHQ